MKLKFKHFIIVAGIALFFYIFIWPFIVVKIIEMDSGKTRAHITTIQTNFSRTGDISGRSISEQRGSFSGRVDISYYYQINGKIYRFEENFDYLDILEISGKKEVILDLSDMEYLPITYSKKYPSLHLVK